MLRCTAGSVSPFCRPASLSGFDDSSAAFRAQVSLATLAITAWRCCQGTLPRYLPKSGYGAINGRSLRLKLRNDILDVIHSRSFLWQLKWDLSNRPRPAVNCSLHLTTQVLSAALVECRDPYCPPAAASARSFSEAIRDPVHGAPRAMNSEFWGVSE